MQGVPSLKQAQPAPALNHPDIVDTMDATVCIIGANFSSEYMPLSNANNGDVLWCESVGTPCTPFLLHSQYLGILSGSPETSKKSDGRSRLRFRRRLLSGSR